MTDNEEFIVCHIETFLSKFIVPEEPSDYEIDGMISPHVNPIGLLTPGFLRKGRAKMLLISIILHTISWYLLSTIIVFLAKLFLGRIASYLGLYGLMVGLCSSAAACLSYYVSWSALDIYLCSEYLAYRYSRYVSLIVAVIFLILWFVFFSVNREIVGLIITELVIFFSSD